MRLALLVLSVLVLASGCGTAPASKPDVRDVAEKSAADSSRIAVSYGGTAYFVGEWDFRKNIGAFSMGPSGWDQIVTAEATYTQVSRFPGHSGQTGKAWMKWEAGPTQVHEFGGSLFGFLPSDPGHLLALLKATSSVHEVGKGQERGVAVRRYRAELDVARAQQRLASDERELFGAMLRQYELGKNGSIPLELAVDHDDRLRRVDVEVPPGEKLSIEFFDYGLDVQPKAPPADEVLSKEELARWLGEGCPKTKDDEDELGSSVCITVSAGEGGVDSVGQRKLSQKEAK